MASLASISASLWAAASLSALIYLRVRRLFEESFSKFAETPLVTMYKQYIMIYNRKQLTTDVSTGTELSSHLRVHGDHHFLFGAHDGVPFFDLVMHPLFELSA